MPRQFLILKLNREPYLTASISGVGVKAQAERYKCFTDWWELENHFIDMGATKEALAVAKDQVEKNGTVSLDI